MTDSVELLFDVLREAWAALASALLIFVLLAVLTQMLRASSTSILGGRTWVAEALSTGAALLMLVLFAFLGVPAILQAVAPAQPVEVGCGPIRDLGALAAGLIGALAALRMLKAFVSVAAAAVVGGAISVSSALLEVGEAVLGMALASAAIPLTAQFLGVCQ